MMKKNLGNSSNKDVKLTKAIINKTKISSNTDGR